MSHADKNSIQRHLVPIIATVFVMLFVWLSMTPLMSWYAVDEPAESLQEAIGKWRSSAVTNYRYVFEISSYYAAPISGPVQITVYHSTVFSAELVESGASIEVDEYPQVPGTIESVHEFVARLLSDPASELSIEYDADLGYPARISVRFDAADDKRATYSIRSFRVLPE